MPNFFNQSSARRLDGYRIYLKRLFEAQNIKPDKYLKAYDFFCKNPEQFNALSDNPIHIRLKEKTDKILAQENRG